MRKSRRRRSEQRRLSDSRKFYVEKNTGLSRTDPKYWSLDKVAKKFKLKSPNPVVVLSKHISARGVNLRAVANGGQDVREELGDTREVTNDENEVTPVLRSGRVGNSGRKPLTDLQKEQRKSLAVATMDRSRRHLYEDLHAQATDLVAKTPAGYKMKFAKTFVEENFEARGMKPPSLKHLLKCAKSTPGERPRPQGGPFWTRDEEEKVRTLVEELRARKLFVSPHLVLAYADALVPEGDERRLKLGPEGITRGVWKDLAARVGVETGTSQNLDTVRARWATAVNFRRWHENIATDLVKEGIAEPNPEHDPANPRAQPRLRILKPQVICSGDETDMSMGAAPKKSKKERGVFLSSSIDTRDVAATKVGRKISWFYGRTGTGKLLPPFIVYGGASKVKPEWISDEVFTDVRDANGELVPTAWRANSKGSVDSEMFREYVTDIIIPCMQGEGVRNEDGKRGMFLLDGCQTHLSNPETTRMLRDAGIMLYFRVPHTSDKMQGEDTVVFRCVYVSSMFY